MTLVLVTQGNLHLENELVNYFLNFLATAVHTAPRRLPLNTTRKESQILVLVHF